MVLWSQMEHSSNIIVITSNEFLFSIAKYSNKNPQQNTSSSFQHNNVFAALFKTNPLLFFHWLNQRNPQRNCSLTVIKLQELDIKIDDDEFSDFFKFIRNVKQGNERIDGSFTQIKIFSLKSLAEMKINTQTKKQTKISQMEATVMINPPLANQTKKKQMEETVMLYTSLTNQTKMNQMEETGHLS